MNCRQAPGVNDRIFWEQKAKSYPLPFGKRTVKRTNRVIGLMEEAGLALEGARILDIGSGPGTFALPLALKGALVTALDVSANMLERLSREQRRVARDLPEIETIRASWKEIDPAEAGLTGMFDIVLSALSIAVETEEDIHKMDLCSRKWCVCIAAGEIRHQPICRTMLQMFGAPVDPRPDIRLIRSTLERMGRPFLYESFPILARRTRNIPQLAEDVAKRLEAQGRTADRHRILSEISSLFTRLGRSETMKCAYSGDRGILMWRVNGAQGHDAR
jgi:SAM-dependent methyltransferase